MAAVEQIPQREALQLYLTMVAGRESAGYFELRSKRTATPGMSQDWISLHEPDRAARSLLNRGETTDTYLGVAPRSGRKGGLEAIEHVWALWADCDSLDALRRLARFDPLPSIVVRSGSDGHAHAYWPLREPLPPNWAKRANRRLALALGADRNATDAARIMRPPGTFNHKHDDRRPVICTRLELDVFTVAEVVGRLPDDADFRPSRLREVPVEFVPSKTIDGLVRTVREATVGNRNARLYWCACRVAEHALGEYAREALRAAAIESGLTEREVDRTLNSALESRLVGPVETFDLE